MENGGCKKTIEVHRDHCGCCKGRPMTLLKRKDASPRKGPPVKQENDLAVWAVLLIVKKTNLYKKCLNIFCNLFYY